MSNKTEYLLDGFKRYFTEKTCPSCGCSDVKLIQRKYVVTRLFECEKCSLMFRHPKDSIQFNKEFYQEEYGQDGGITTTLPNSEELDELLKDNFKNTDKSVADFVKIFDALSTGEEKLNLTDYGASWGYMTYQFLNRGYAVDSFEISKSRAGFGNDKLKLKIKTDESDLKTNQDIFFSSHVIEHVPVVSSMVELSKKLLKKGGYFIAVCPNGSIDFKTNNEFAFKRYWGQVHPNLLSEKFYKEIFKSNPYILLSSPLSNEKIKQISEWNQKDQLDLDTSGPEILVIAKLNMD
jgi:2-polyprenyl-3-methyl-5-hydroxy-6-metoxy-1,4-benzoquinol methylase